MLATGGMLRVPRAIRACDAEALVVCLEESPPPLHPFSPAFEAQSVGQILDHVRDLRVYFDAVPQYRDWLDRVGAGRLEATVIETLESLAGGASLRVPEHPVHGRYGFSTLRRLPTGGLIPPHCETEQFEGPQYAHLRGLMRDGGDVLSWFVMLQCPEAGGELCQWEVGRDSDQARALYADRMRAGEILAGSDFVCSNFEVGELVVFAGGRRFHEVRPVEGPIPRWTLGGFVFPARSGELLAFC